MIDYEKLLDALQTIQNECAKYKCCTDCPFFVQSEDINCGILSRNPVNWKLNKVHVILLKRRRVSTADRDYIAFKLKSITLDKQFERMMKKWKSK
jgi:hypothetical protein